MVLAANGEHLRLYLGPIAQAAEIGRGTAALLLPKVVDHAFLILIELFGVFGDTKLIQSRHFSCGATSKPDHQEW